MTLMKTFLLSLFLFLSLFSFSQKNNKLNEEQKFIRDLEIGIIEAINNHRINLKDSSEILSRESVLDSASSYHNEYLKILNFDSKNSFSIIHDQSKNVDDLVYYGSNQILPSFMDRVSKFDTNKKFYASTEIIFCAMGLKQTMENPDKDIKVISNQVLTSWLNSKGHKQAVESFRTKIGMSVYLNHESNAICVVSVLANKKIN